MSFLLYVEDDSRLSKEDGGRAMRKKQRYRLLKFPVHHSRNDPLGSTQRMLINLLFCEK
jgi:hypothetical protein